MPHPRQAIVEGLAAGLLPALTLGFFVAVLRDALGTIPALIDALTTAPPWAQVYLGLTTSLALGCPAVVLALTGEGAPDPERIVPRQSQSDAP